MDTIFRLEQITKFYKDTNYLINVLEELDFSIKKADMIAITGKSGSGKSTLLHIMGLLDIPNSGKIFFNETEISAKDKNIEAFRNRNIGFVFQFHYLLADFTALENVALPLMIAGKSFSIAKKRANELLTELGMAGRINHFPNQLSGGEQQRVSIARAIINEPQLIIADEPTGNLDKNHADDILTILKKLNEEKLQTVVLATHDQEIAKSMKAHYHLDNNICKLLKIE
ncbi:MAG: ABC transporter ATP-binding protein [Candidatus Cloacimonetes bacterium]|nr:ABC transporter ATP-binding protein [Candidatus Cloacimonadota bacterium]